MILVDTSVWVDWLRHGERSATALLDRLIAQLAIEYRAPLLHDDRYFEEIARVEPALVLLQD